MTFQIEKAKFGIEHEFFVLSEGSPPLPEQIYEFAAYLGESAQAVKTPANSSARPLPVYLNSIGGPVEIKTECYSHILEVAFPPFLKVDLFTKTFDEVAESIQVALSRTGLEIFAGAVYSPNSSDQLHVCGYSHEQEERLASFLKRTVPDRPFSDRHLLARVCSTQVHMEIPEQDYFVALPMLYRFQYLVPLGFSNSRENDSAARPVHCVRALMLRDSVCEPWPPFTIPNPIPKSKIETSRIIDGLPHRDYTFLALHPIGTIEFRTSDSLPSQKSILSMIALQVAVTHISLQSPCVNGSDSDSLFWNACEKGQVDGSLLDNDLMLLEQCVLELPELLRDPFINSLETIWSQNRG